MEQDWKRSDPRSLRLPAAQEPREEGLLAQPGRLGSWEAALSRHATLEWQALTGFPGT